ncbi:MAG: bifunctional diguanylate cyclase/phosphodiesterase [Pseudomonadota bacterium]
MKRHKIAIISERKTDHLILGDCLRRAVPDRFEVLNEAATPTPQEALTDPGIDALILAHGPETEYLLRLAKREDSTTPIILLLDEDTETVVSEIRELGAQDHLVRGQVQDQLTHRIVDYSIQLKAARERIRQLSNRDTLTGALNRGGFRAHLERAIERSRRYGFKTGLLLFNMDRFSQVNDHYGEAEGDRMIVMASKRLVSQMRSTDSIARLAGDEFAVVLEDAGDAVVEALAGKMLRAIGSPMELNGQQVTLEASVGAAVFPDDGDDFSSLVERARDAMQQAKAVQGSHFMRYSDRISFGGGEPQGLAAELRSAMRQNQFELHYQPRVDLRDGRLTGLEALLRWNHPERGLLAPADFLTTCEDMGLMRNIGYQVIQHACSALTWLDGEGLGDVDVAVNISFSQIQDERFVDVVRDILARTGADGGRLELELTESTILKSPSAIKSRMDELRELGISFSLDDFGTGFSQLTHLAELPISSLKIDTSFVRDVPHNTQRKAICIMIIDMVHRLGMTVVAEGAENHEQVEFLRDQGCHQVQGFYYSPAIQLRRLPEFIREQRFEGNEKLIS